MKNAYKRFMSDPCYLLKNFFFQTLGLSFIAALINQLGESIEFEFRTWHLAFLPLSILAGVQIPSLLHNAVHGNIKKKWVCEVTGEICGFFTMIGQAPFKISHAFHHAHPDGPLDPHPPMEKSFIKFLATSQLNSIRVINRAFYQRHGKNLKNDLILFSQFFFYYTAIALRIIIVFFYLPEELIYLFFIPAFLTNILVFTHINYATHLDDEIHNLNDNLYYKFVNLVGYGVYFHKNHHLRPRLFNPSKMNA